MILTKDEIRTLIIDVYQNVYPKGEISPLLFMGQVITESSGNTNAFVSDSNGGSYGLFQIDKAFLKEWGFDPNTNLYDPKENTKVALSRIKNIFHGYVGNPDITKLKYNLRVMMSFVCYNCGPGNFNLMFKNHLSKHLDWDWNDAIQNKNLVSNWKSCLRYPVKVLYYTHTIFGLPIESTITSPFLPTPICLVSTGSLGPYKVVN
jgi:hypothetical protein